MKILTKMAAVNVLILTIVAPYSARAALIYDSTVHLTGQGFGSNPRDLTIQATGKASTESGCVGVSASGGIVIGHAACLSDALVHNKNGVANAGGSEPAPRADNNKYGIPSAASLGIGSADQLGILFNPTEPGMDSANVADLTLKFYTSTGGLLGAINGQQNFPSTDPGNGIAGFVFVVSPDEYSYVNGLLGSNPILALEATITGIGGGPESFILFKKAGSPPPPVPVPAALPLLGSALAALGLLRRKRI